VNAYTVLQDHHKVLKGLAKKVSSTPAIVPERQQYLDDLLVELDIHFRIEDDLYYPALSAASSLIAIAHAEHRQAIDQLSVFAAHSTDGTDLRRRMAFLRNGLGGARRQRRARHDSGAPVGENQRPGTDRAGRQNGIPHRSAA
jgi:hypothetical protein